MDKNWIFLDEIIHKEPTSPEVMKLIIEGVAKKACEKLTGSDAIIVIPILEGEEVTTETPVLDEPPKKHG